MYTFELSLQCDFTNKIPNNDLIPRSMAKPIKETPILKGADARKFMENMAASASKKVDDVTKAKIKASFDRLNAIAQF